VGTLEAAALGLGQPGGGVGVQPKLDEPGVAALDAGDQFGLQRGLPGRAGGCQVKSGVEAVCTQQPLPATRADVSSAPITGSERSREPTTAPKPSRCSAASPVHPASVPVATGTPSTSPSSSAVRSTGSAGRPAGRFPAPALRLRRPPAR
jgi:hypothetical protein